MLVRDTQAVVTARGKSGVGTGKSSHLCVRATPFYQPGAGQSKQTRVRVLPGGQDRGAKKKKNNKKKIYQVISFLQTNLSE